MATRYPTQKEKEIIQSHADQGDTSARDYLKLLDVLTDILEGSNGISLARGMIGEHNDVYGHAIDDALAELVPVIVEIAAGGWESLKFYASESTQSDEEEVDTEEE